MRFNERLNILHPIIQSPMAGVQNHELAVAVSNAGGLGSLPCAMLSLNALLAELTAINQKTQHPVNLNFFCHTSPKYNATREADWQAELQPFYDEYGIDPSDITTASDFPKFNHDTIDVLSKFKPNVISFHFGLPRDDLLARVKNLGLKILSTATTLEEALWLESKGVDAIIAQGLEAGGHRGMFLSADLSQQQKTFELLADIVPHVNIPVIAAGGIADSEGIANALSLGASAVQMGTAFLLCTETKTSTLHRAAIARQHVNNTAITNVFTGRPARSIVNTLVETLGPINEHAPEFPLAIAAYSPLRQIAEHNKKDTFTPLWCGTNTRGCQEISAHDLLKRLTSN